MQILGKLYSQIAFLGFVLLMGTVHITVQQW